MNDKFEKAPHLINVSQVATEQDEKKKVFLLKTIRDLINLSIDQCYFEISPLPHQSGLVLHFNRGYYCFQLDLFTNLNQLGLLKYSEKIPPPHYTDIYSGKLSTNSEKDRALHRAEYLSYKIITAVDYEALFNLSKDWLSSSNKINEILKKHFSSRCSFNVNVFGVSLSEFGSYFDSPIYNHFIRPTVTEICERSELGLRYNYITLVHTKIYKNETDWGKFESLVQEAVENNWKKYQAYEEEHLKKNHIRNERLAQALGIVQNALETTHVNEKQEVEIIFSKQFQDSSFLQATCGYLAQQRVKAQIKGGMIVIPCSERERLTTLVEKGETFCVFTNHPYSFTKKALTISENESLQLFRDLSFLYIKTTANSQKTTYRKLRQNYLNCEQQEDGLVKLPIREVQDFNYLIQSALNKKPNRYEVCSSLGIKPKQLTIEKDTYAIDFSSEQERNEFEKKFKSQISFQSILFSKESRIYASRDFQLFIEEQQFLLEEKKLENYFLNNYPKIKPLITELSEYQKAPFDNSWLKMKFGEEIVKFKNDFFGISFYMSKESALYTKTETYFKKLNCGIIKLFDGCFTLNKKAKWHIICAVECIFGNEIDVDSILNDDAPVEKEILSASQSSFKSSGSSMYASSSGPSTFYHHKSESSATEPTQTKSLVTPR